jgi:hypothetical protein
VKIQPGIEPATSRSRVISNICSPEQSKGEPLMTMRFVTAAAVLSSVGIHLTLWLQGMRDVNVIGDAFLVNIVSGILIAVLLVVWRHWLPPALAACFGLATLGAFTIASTVGLFGDHETWQGLYVFGAAGVEVLTILLGLTLVLEEPETAPALAQPRGAHLASNGRASNRSERA